MRGLSPSDKYADSYRRSLRGWITWSVQECPSDGRVPIVAMKRDNTRGAKGNRILVKSMS
jgi:hypothetical protein